MSGESITSFLEAAAPHPDLGDGTADSFEPAASCTRASNWSHASEASLRPDRLKATGWSHRTADSFEPAAAPWSHASEASLRPDRLLATGWSHVSKFKRQGKQGVVGLARDATGEVYVYKCSQFFNYNVLHEEMVMKRLEADWNPHFNEAVRVERIPLHPRYKHPDQDPFAPHPKAVIVEVLFLKIVQFNPSAESIAMRNLLQTDTEPCILMSVLKQTMLALDVAYRKTSFVHYDMHSDNILLTRASADVYVYRVGVDEAVCVPTYGLHPIIIDFGFSAIDAQAGQPMTCASLAFTDCGYLSPHADAYTDAKKLLMSLGAEMILKDFDEDLAHPFVNLVENLFSESITSEFESGSESETDEVKRTPILDTIFNYCTDAHEPSTLFSIAPFYCFDILQRLIPCPERIDRKPDAVGSWDALRYAYRAFVDEWVKIEDRVNDPFYNLYIFKRMVDLMAQFPVSETDGTSAVQFERGVYDVVRSVAKFVKLDRVDFKTLLAAGWALVGEMRAKIHLEMYDRVRKLEDRVDVTMRDAFALIDCAFPDTSFTFEEGTTIRVMDAVDERTYDVVCDAEWLPFLNDPAYRLYRGNFIVDATTAASEDASEASFEGSVEPIRDETSDVIETSRGRITDASRQANHSVVRNITL
jgi:hypothetical protein